MKKIFVLALAMVMVLSLGAFAKTPEEVLEEETYGGTIYIGRTQSPEGMFTPLYGETTYDSDIYGLVFEGLTSVNKNFEATPALAKKWTVSDDNKTYTFYLDNRAKFHDGEPVTAEDVKYTFEMFLHPDYGGVRASRFEPILGAEAYGNGEADHVKGIKIIDDHTVEITLKDIYAPFLVTTATFGIVPEHILGEYSPSELDKVPFNQNPVGSGPFKFVEYKTEEYTKLAAFKDYHGGRPYLDNVVFRYIEDANRLIMLKKGELDWVQGQGSEFEEYQNLNNYNLHSQIRNGFGYLAFNLKKKDSVVSNQPVRQAIAHGINRKGFQKVVMGGLAINPNSPISQASWAYTNDLNPYEYDPSKAKEILHEAGWKDTDGDGVMEKNGKDLAFTITASSGSQFIDQLVALAQDNLNSIGFDVKLERIEFNTMREQMNEGVLDCWFMGWTFGADPDPYATWHSEGDWNRTGFENERADELIEEARSTIDKYDRTQAYVEFQKIWNESMPYLPMYANIYVNVVNKRVHGYDPAPGSMNVFLDFDILNEIWIPKDSRR